MEIANVGGDVTYRDYSVRTLFGRGKEQLDRRRTQREGSVEGHPSGAVHVWFLVAKALLALGYIKAPKKRVTELFS
jgi:hypothetical protein